MIKFKHESISDQDGIENLLDLVFSPSRINLSSYSLRKKVPKVKTLCFVAKNTDGSIIGVIRYWPVLIGEKKQISLLIGPIAIHPTFQGEDGLRRRLGSLDECRFASHEICVFRNSQHA